ncbi:MAG: flavodoxin family protein, partial [Spirochaetes bacterium]|nr:flavodoxin family protein [Spirochaetota bacterium]
ANDNFLRGKIGGPVVVARRAGQNFTYAQLLFFFTINEMVIPGSTYWNIAFGRNKGEVMDDEEGIETVKTFAKNIADLLSKLKQ